MMNLIRCVKCLAVALLISQSEIFAPNVLAEEQATFHKDVANIFEQHCLRCHSSKNAKGGLSLSTRSGFLKGGESGELVLAKRPDESLLIDIVSGSDPSMPAEGAPLTATEIEILRNWIAAGAQWPNDLELHEKIRGGKDWWSFQPIRRPSLPEVKDTSWPRNDLDRFILAKLEEQNLSPSPEADRLTLIRRLSFDLLGLPSDPREISAFIADEDLFAYERLVDRMLESPHYGERWARHWMDIAHYADTHGFERDQLRNHAWRYRDYVIQALNADKPYNQFLREQIAGDVLHPNDSESVIATGFLAVGPWDYVGQMETTSPALNRAARADDLDDMVTQVMATSIGLTVNCARCHDHKLDPILQKEYYQLWSVFAGVKRGDRNSDPAEVQRVETVRQKLQAELDANRARQSELRGSPLLLADVVGGGDGHGSGKAGWGIDPLTGNPQHAFRQTLPGVQLNAFQKSSLRFVDGVVIPDASEDGTVISSTGLRIQHVPKTTGQTWDAIRFGPLNSQFSTELVGIDYGSAGHTLLSLHANSAITFDLDELRLAGAPNVMKLTSSAGYFGQTAKAGASIYIYVDGQLKLEHIGLGRDDGLISIDLDLATENRFLTFMATDNDNGISNDQICFGDARLTAKEPPYLDSDQREELKFLEERSPRIEQELKSLPTPEKVYSVVSEEPPPIHLLHRGDTEQPGEEVQPGTLSCLAGMSAEFEVEGNNEGERRLALANWIIDPDHPLTRRVIVNRLWHHHFGQGIVDTPGDFGYGGGLPSHPELLDWLAEELLKNDWSLKQMHRQICNSATYRQQSSVRRPDAESVDLQNRLLWRMNARKLDAESLWDATLTVSGKINLDMKGPGFRDFRYTEAYAPIYEHVTADSPELWRRAIYRFIVRTTPNQFMTTLDCPNPGNITPVRNVTTTALQSLALLNNDFMLRQSVYLADRVQAGGDSTPDTLVQRAFMLTFGRNPTEQESAVAVKYLEAGSLQQLCRMLLNSNEFVYID